MQNLYVDSNYARLLQSVIRTLLAGCRRWLAGWLAGWLGNWSVDRVMAGCDVELAGFGRSEPLFELPMLRFR